MYVFMTLALICAVLTKVSVAGPPRKLQGRHSHAFAAFCMERNFSGRLRFMGTTSVAHPGTESFTTVKPLALPLFAHYLLFQSGQDRVYRDYLLPRRPPGDFDPRLYSHRESPSKEKGIAGQLYEVIQMRVRNILLPQNCLIDMYTGVLGVRPVYNRH